MKRLIFFKCLCVVLTVAIIVVLAIFGRQQYKIDSSYEDGMDDIDPNTIILDGGKVRVSFSDVILSEEKETRKLVVFEQDGTVTAKIEDRVVKQLDVDALKKNQSVTYTATGHFIVDLDNLNESNLIDDKDNKILTIKITHPHLDSIDIDPNEIKIGEKDNGLLAFGKLKLSLEDYNDIEKDLQKRLQEKFDTSANGQKADDLAIKAVYDIYEPIVKAVDEDYKLQIEFVD